MNARDGQVGGGPGAPVTGLLVVLNMAIQAMFAAMLIRSPESIGRVFELFQLLGLVPDRFWSGAFWQPLTSMFLHGVFAGLDLLPDGTFRTEVPTSWAMATNVLSWGSLHVVANMVAVWSLGRAMEETLGSMRFLGLYLVSGLGGALLTLALDSSGPQAATVTVGASGGVVGILGALAVFYPHSRLLVFFFPMQARTAALGLGAISLFFLLGTERGFVSHTGHLGGLVAGLAYSRFALQLQIAREQLAELPMGLRRAWRRGPHAISKPSARQQNIESAPGPGTRVVYDPDSGRYVHKQP